MNGKYLRNTLSLTQHYNFIEETAKFHSRDAERIGTSGNLLAASYTEIIQLKERRANAKP